MVPRAQFRSYYGRPILKRPSWSPEVALYLFTGGLAGASASLAVAARAAGDDTLARRALLISLGGFVVSAPLLIADLGRPERFVNMLRVVKPTSPMSVGSWVLTASGSATGAAAASEVLGVLRPAGRAAELVAGGLGPVMATYTGVLLADTAVPVWHESRYLLPAVFAGSALASAGAAAVLATSPGRAAMAREAAVLGATLEVGAAAVMERRLGRTGDPLRGGTPARLGRAARALTVAGAAALALGGRRRTVAAVGALGLLAGSVCERLAVFRAGFDSAAGARHDAKGGGAGTGGPGDRSGLRHTGAELAWSSQSQSRSARFGGPTPAEAP